MYFSHSHDTSVDLTKRPSAWLKKAVAAAVCVSLVSFGAPTVPALADTGDEVRANLQEISNDEYMTYRYGFIAAEELRAAEAAEAEARAEAAEEAATATTVTATDGLEAFVASIEEDGNPLASTFQDVISGYYYAEPIDYVSSLGIMDGTSSTRFSPDSPATRAIIVEALYRVEGCPSAPSPSFTDVSLSSPYAAAIGWAAANGIVTGFGDTGLFKPDNAIERQQLAAILHRYVKYKNLDDGSRADLSKFSDYKQVQSWATDDFAWANACSIITGVSGKYLQPAGGATRGQLATVVMRYCQNILHLDAQASSTTSSATTSTQSSTSGTTSRSSDVPLTGTDQTFAEDGSTTSGTAYTIPSSVTLSPANMSSAVSGNNASIDVSTASSGYVTATAKSSSRLKLQVVNGQMSYNYDMTNTGTPITVPLNMGNGTYKIRVMQNTTGSKYVEQFSTTVNVVLPTGNEPFLRPNVFCNYSASSSCVTKAKELAKDAKNQGAVLRAVYTWITKNITYDRSKAAQLSNSTGYVPNPDETLRTKKGICFDYASLAAAMLRSLGIPCKVMTGYVAPNNLYHSWNMVYIDGKWVSVSISVDARTWTRMDATFAASGGGLDALVGNGTSYTDRYTY